MLGSIWIEIGPNDLNDLSVAKIVKIVSPTGLREAASGFS